MASEPVLKKGAKGKAVERLQRALAAAGHAVAVDGDFGAGTERAVRAFQAAHGLEADGVVGPATWAALGVGARGAGPAVADAGAQRLSKKGAAFIAHFEGFEAKLYNDPVGHCHDRLRPPRAPRADQRQRGGGVQARHHARARARAAPAGRGLGRRRDLPQREGGAHAAAGRRADQLRVQRRQRRVPRLDAAQAAQRWRLRRACRRSSTAGRRRAAGRSRASSGAARPRARCSAMART